MGWLGRWSRGQPGEFRAGTCAPRTRRAVNPGSHKVQRARWATRQGISLREARRAREGAEGIHSSPPPEKMSRGAVRPRVARTE